MENASSGRDPNAIRRGPIGPAVSPRRSVGAGLSLSPAHPLPPFSRPGSEIPPPVAEDVAVAAPLPEEPTFAELPEVEPWEDAGLQMEVPPQWIDPDVQPAPEAEDDLGLVRGSGWEVQDGAEEPEVDVAEEPEVDIAELLWEEPAWVEPETAPEVPSEVEPETFPEPEALAAPMEDEAPHALDEWALVAATPEAPVGDATGFEREGEAPVPPEPAQDAAAAPVPRIETTLAEVMSKEEGAVMEEVAGRLERIALALREGRPVELFSSGASDPLEVLIAGYALGYSEAVRRLNNERRSGA